MEPIGRTRATPRVRPALAKAGVDRERPTQFGRAIRQLGVEMIPAYSPEARGRCERMFATHQSLPPRKRGERLPKELAARGIDTMPEANRYLAGHYRGAFNEEFAVAAAEPGAAFVPFIGPGLADVLCEHHERTVSRDNCVSFEGKRLQIPAQTCRCHFIKAPWCIVTLMGVWRCSTGRASWPSTSPTALWWQTTCALRRPVEQWLAERAPVRSTRLGMAPSYRRAGGRDIRLENSLRPDVFALPPPACARERFRGNVGFSRSLPRFDRKNGGVLCSRNNRAHSPDDRDPFAVVSGFTSDSCLMHESDSGGL